MAVCLYRVTHPTTLGDPADAAINDFVFLQPDTLLVADIATIAGKVKDFFATTPTGGTNPLNSYYAGPWGTSNPTYQVYDITTHLAGTPMGSPIATGTMSAAFSADTTHQNMPTNVSAILELRSEYGTAVEFGGPDAAIPTDHRARVEGAPATHAGNDRPRSRHRSRLHLGPLNALAVTGVGTGGQCVLTGTFTNDACAAASTLAHAIDLLFGGAGAAEWRQWSRRDATTRRITHASMRGRFGFSSKREDAAPILASYTWA